MFLFSKGDLQEVQILFSPVSGEEQCGTVSLRGLTKYPCIDTAPQSQKAVTTYL